MPKFKEKTKIIEVKPVDAADTAHIMKYDEKNVSASPDIRGIISRKVSLLGNAIMDNTSEDGSDSTIVKTEEDEVKYVQNMMNVIKNGEQMKRNVVDEVTKTNEGNNDVDSKDVSGDTNDGVNETKKKKGKKKKKKKNKAKLKAAETDEAKQSNDKKSNENPQEDEEVVDIGQTDTKEKKKKRKLPCLFGFVASWLAKRKERRREKKRKAIEARSQTPAESLVEYEHKRAKGGMAFTVQVDSRPMRKAVLPPIKQHPGPIMQGMDEKLRLAEQKRMEEITKKKESAKEIDRKIAECQERKTESEYHFKQKAHLTIRYKQYGAEKNRARLQEDRRCSSPMLRAPSTLPPLRNVRVKPSAKGRPNGSPTAEDPDDALFNF
ncbi:uncharacterized protein LOC123540464 [Mercenaria mercenaria]|uniref:uncharacterized protein LOC123540464 n=1 Tax=Mercenaria mercenaria TaxID=6596 RepID=UPI00234F9A84|nr:uncharacterized protein LOC123540464 [Mercenaria mercenaria]